MSFMLVGSFELHVHDEFLIEQFNRGDNMRMLKSFLIVAVAGFSSLISNLAHADLLVNGGFEDPSVVAQKNFAFAGGASFPGWSISGVRSAIINNSIGSTFTLGAVWPQAQEGSKYLYLNDWGNNNTSASQSINLDGGKAYHLSFYLNGLVNGLQSTFDYSPSVAVSLSGVGSIPFAAMARGTDNHTWTKLDFDFSIATSGSYLLSFATPTNPLLPPGQRYNFIALDHVELSAAPVPEPETYSLMLAGLGILGFFGRRKKKHSGKCLL